MKQNTSSPQPGRTVVRILRGVLLLGAVVILLVAISLGLLGAAVVNQARQNEAAQAEAIVVLGTAQWNGYPSTTFRARLDHAHSLYQEGYANMVVLTGGVAPNDVYSEAEAGAAYLRELGVPDDHLLTIPEGRSSLASLKPVAEALLERGRERVILVSDPFHMFRVKQMASDLGLEPMTSPTTTSPIRPGSPSEQRYVIREVFAYLNYVFFES